MSKFEYNGLSWDVDMLDIDTVEGMKTEWPQYLKGWQQLRPEKKRDMKCYGKS